MAVDLCKCATAMEVVIGRRNGQLHGLVALMVRGLEPSFSGDVLQHLATTWHPASLASVSVSPCHVCRGVGPRCAWQTDISWEPDHASKAAQARGLVGRYGSGRIVVARQGRPSGLHIAPSPGMCEHCGPIGLLAERPSEAFVHVAMGTMAWRQPCCSSWVRHGMLQAAPQKKSPHLFLESESKMGIRMFCKVWGDGASAKHDVW